VTCIFGSQPHDLRFAKRDTFLQRLTLYNSKLFSSTLSRTYFLSNICLHEASFNMISPEDPSSSSQRASSTVPYDPPGQVLTTDRLDAYMGEGGPMLNNYTRHSRIGGGQHGEVYLCYKINTRYPPGHPDRRMAVVSPNISCKSSLLRSTTLLPIGYEIGQTRQPSC